MAIEGIKAVEQLKQALQPQRVEAAAATGDFQLPKLLEEGVGKVNTQLNSADKLSQEFLLQGKHNLHEVVIALEQADVSFRYMQQIRNKVLDAYNDIMRMQV